jgi:metallophosphoesterase (TIGR00282 family)
VLLVGDVIGKPGRVAIERTLPGLREARGVDLVTANGENLAGGMGLTASTAQALLDAGVDVITSGNHIWDKREIYPVLETEERILRPLNYGTHDVPGRGWGIFHAADGTEVAVINLQGRTYMQPIDNPFTEADRLLDEGAAELPPVRIVDFHCEITSEKTALGVYLDGRVSAVVGTHTHVVTGDERILPKGTAYQSDLGMTGPLYSVIGFDPKTVLPRFVNALPTRFEVGEGPVVLQATQVDIDPATGRALAIERLRRLVEV